MRKKFLLIGFLGLALGLLGLLCVGPKTALAANPTTVNFQGKVVNSDGTNVTDGTYSFVFRIYNTSSPTPTTACSGDATCLFEETQSSVSVTSGTFQVELGSTCSGGLVASNSCTKSAAGGLNFSSNNSLYLTLQFNGDTSGTHGGFMWPVIHLTSAPYAYYADNAGTLTGLPAGSFVQLAQGLQTDSSSSNASIAINKTGTTANIVTLQRGGTSVLTVDNGGALSITPVGNNIGAIIRQTTGTATSGNIFDIQGANTTSHFIQVTETAANQGSISITSLGSNGLTLQSGSGTVTLGSSTVLTASAGLQVSSGSGNLTLDAAGGTIALGANTLSVVFTKTGTAVIDAASGQELDLGAAASAHTTKVGSSGGGSTTTVQSGTGGINLLPDGGTNTGAIVKPTNDSTKAFQVQTAGGNAVLGVATSTTEASNFVSLGLSSNLNGRLLFNNSAGTNAITLQAQAVNPGSSFSLQLPTALPGASNYCVVSSNLGTLSFLPCGAGSTATVTLSPEFFSSVMSGVGGSNIGTMTSDYCAGSSKFPSGVNTSVCTVSTDEHNYYSWTANSGNSYDIFVRWSVPQDFASFSSGSFNYWKTAAGDTVTMNVYPGSSTACATQSASGTSAAWASQSITMTGCSPSAGGVITIDIHLAIGTNGDFARIGEIALGYNRK